SLRSFLLQRVDQQLSSGWQVVLHALNDPNDTSPGPPGSSSLPPGTFGEVMDADGHVIGKPVWLYQSSGSKPSLPAKLPTPGEAAAPRVDRHHRRRDRRGRTVAQDRGREPQDRGGKARVGAECDARPDRAGVRGAEGLGGSPPPLPRGRVP